FSFARRRAVCRPPNSHYRRFRVCALWIVNRNPFHCSEPASAAPPAQEFRKERGRANALRQAIGAPGTTRTCDLGIRRPLLYPPELRRQCAGQSIQLCPPIRFPAATRAKSLPAPRLSVIVMDLDTRTTPAGHRPLTATRRVHNVEG